MPDSGLHAQEPLQERTPSRRARPLRILAITNAYPIAEAPASGIFIEQQIKSLREVGLQIDLMFVDRLRQGMRVYFGLRDSLRSQLEKFQPDLVHVMYGGVMADIATRAVDDRPTIVTFHGSDLLGEPMSRPLRRGFARYGVWASWRAARRATRVIAVASRIRNALPQDLDQSKVCTIPCGIDLERFKPLSRRQCRQQLGWNSDMFHILFPSNLGDPVKRPELAEATLGPLKQLGITAEMHYLRRIPNELVPLWLNASDVLLLTSRHEGSPTVVKEALACNVPIVSVDVGDVPERINGIDGCYLARPEAADLATKLSLIYSGHRRVAGRAKITELSLDRVSLRLKYLYEDVVHLQSTDQLRSSQ